MAVPISQTGVWLNRPAFEDAEAQYFATGKTVSLTLTNPRVSFPAGVVCTGSWDMRIFSWLRFRRSTL